MKLADFLRQNEPPKGEKIQYWSEWIHEDHVTYTPYVVDEGYREDLKVQIPLPEPIVRLPIPGWAFAATQDWTYAEVGAVQMFKSEAAEAVTDFISQLERFLS